VGQEASAKTETNKFKGSQPQLILAPLFILKICITSVKFSVANELSSLFL
jgi:hypothetical protein